MLLNGFRFSLLIFVFIFTKSFNLQEGNIVGYERNQGNPQMNDFPPEGKDHSQKDNQPNDNSNSKSQQKLEEELKRQLELNETLKREIDRNLKYITILSITGITMFSIIIFIVCRTFCNYRKKQAIVNEMNITNSYKTKIINMNNNNINENNENKNIFSSSASSIEESNYNLLKNEKNKSQSNNMINSYNMDKDLEENNNINNYSSEEKVKNYDAPNMANYSNIVLNDDNKTLTNNPDMFVPSRTDKILYKPYKEI